VPLSTNVTDEIADTVFSGVDNKSCATTFAAAEAEVLDYLIAEVYPAFESSTRLSLSGQHGSSKSSGSSSNLLGTTKSRFSRRRRSVLSNPNSTDYASMHNIMSKILSDPAYLALFRAYMVRCDAENLLYVLCSMLLFLFLFVTSRLSLSIYYCLPALSDAAWHESNHHLPLIDHNAHITHYNTGMATMSWWK
jgi:hypothetical protein